MNTSKEKRDRFIDAGSEIEKELLSLFGKDDEIGIADIGACDGMTTIIYALLFPRAKLYAFEPRPDNIELFNENVRDRGVEQNIELLMQTAIGNKNGTVDFYCSSGQDDGIVDWDTGNRSSSIYPPVAHLKCFPWCKFDEKITVPIMKLDEVKHTNPNMKIDFAHIDTQGAETDVLLGGKRAFAETKAIWLEVANVELYQGQPKKHELSRILDGMGFKMELDTCTKIKSFGDMLWIRK